MKRNTTLLLTALAALTMSACDTLDNFMSETFDSNAKPSRRVSPSPSAFTVLNDCPEVKIVDELSSLSDFSSPFATTEDMLVSRVNLIQVESSCSYSERTVSVDLKLAFEGVLGPKSKLKASDKPFFTYPFFVAVSGRDGSVLAKEVFSASLAYETDEQRKTYYENLRQVIPLKAREFGPKHKVLLGFQLNQHQLAFNRQNMVPVSEPKMQMPPAQDQAAPPAIRARRMEQNDNFGPTELYGQ